MHRFALMRSTFALVCSALLFAGCASTEPSEGSTGSLSLDLVLEGGVQIDEVAWAISGNDMDMSGTIDVSAPGSTASVEVFGLLPGDGYLVELSATSVDGETTCRGSAPFSVEVGVSTPVMVILNCKLPQRLGGVRVNGKFNICAEVSKMVVSPLQTSVGNDMDLLAEAVDVEGDPITFLWTSDSGTIADPMATETTYTCTEVGDDEITVLVTDDGGTYCMSMRTIPVTCVAGDGDLCEGVTCEDDGNECTAEACNPANGQCETSNVEDGTACGDGGACMDGTCVTTDLCEGVTCEDDGNECTAEACNPSTGECETSNVDNGTACGDGGACMDGTCVQDLCAGVVCDPTGNDCTVAMCNSQTGECDVMNVPNGTECNDGAGACSNGECLISNLCDGVDCTSTDECIQDGTCDPGTGECQPGEPEPAGTACTTGGGAVCDGAGNCVVCNVDQDCGEGQACVDNVCVTPPECLENTDCDDGNECTQDVCDTGMCSNPNEPNGTSCNSGAGQCTDGTCVVAADFDFPLVQLGVDMCCNNNALPQQSIIPIRLDVDPGSATPGGAFSADLGGLLTFPESFLDVAQTVVPGGTLTADLVQAQVTVLPRGTGATGAPVAVPPVFPAGTCLIGGTACDVANNVNGISFGFPGFAGNTDCVPTGNFNPCQRLVTVPTDPDLADCQALDPPGCTPGTDCTKADQHALNGFCVTGALPIPLQSVSGAYTAGSSGDTMLFGWSDDPAATGAMVAGGVVTIASSPFATTLKANELKVSAGGLAVAINCHMAVETGDTETDPVTCGVTPDGLLVGSGFDGTDTYLIP